MEIALEQAHNLKVAGSNPAPATKRFQCLRKEREWLPFRSLPHHCRSRGPMRPTPQVALPDIVSSSGLADGHVNRTLLCLNAPDYESGGRGFESLPTRQ